MAKSEETLTESQFVEACNRLQERLFADPIVSEDIKQLAAAVAILANGLKDTREMMVELADRPVGKTINVNYGK